MIAAPISPTPRMATVVSLQNRPCFSATRSTVSTTEKTRPFNPYTKGFRYG